MTVFKAPMVASTAGELYTGGNCFSLEISNASRLGLGRQWIADSGREGAGRRCFISPGESVIVYMVMKRTGAIYSHGNMPLLIGEKSHPPALPSLEEI